MSEKKKVTVDELIQTLEKFRKDLNEEKDYDKLLHMKSTWLKNREYVYKYTDPEIIKLYKRIDNILEQVLKDNNIYIKKNIKDFKEKYNCANNKLSTNKVDTNEVYRFIDEKLLNFIKNISNGNIQIYDIKEFFEWLVNISKCYDIYNFKSMIDELVFILGDKNKEYGQQIHDINKNISYNFKKVKPNSVLLGSAVDRKRKECSLIKKKQLCTEECEWVSRYGDSSWYSFWFRMFQKKCKNKDYFQFLEEVYCGPNSYKTKEELISAIQVFSQDETEEQFFEKLNNPIYYTYHINGTEIDLSKKSEEDLKNTLRDIFRSELYHVPKSQKEQEAFFKKYNLTQKQIQETMYAVKDMYYDGIKDPVSIMKFLKRLLYYACVIVSVIAIVATVLFAYSYFFDENFFSNSLKYFTTDKMVPIVTRPDYEGMIGPLYIVSYENHRYLGTIPLTNISIFYENNKWEAVDFNLYKSVDLFSTDLLSIVKDQAFDTFMIKYNSLGYKSEVLYQNLNYNNLYKVVDTSKNYISDKTYSGLQSLFKLFKISDVGNLTMNESDVGNLTMIDALNNLNSTAGVNVETLNNMDTSYFGKFTNVPFMPTRPILTVLSSMYDWCGDVLKNPTNFSRIKDGAFGIYEKAHALRVAAALTGGIFAYKAVKKLLNKDKNSGLNPDFNMYDFVENELNYTISKKEILPIDQINPIDGKILMKSTLTYIDRYLKGEKYREEAESVPVVKQTLNKEIKYYILDNHDKYYAKRIMNSFGIASSDILPVDIINLPEGVTLSDFINKCLERPETRIFFDKKAFEQN